MPKMTCHQNKHYMVPTPELPVAVKLGRLVPDQLNIVKRTSLLLLLCCDILFASFSVTLCSKGWNSKSKQIHFWPARDRFFRISGLKADNTFLPVKVKNIQSYLQPTKVKQLREFSNMLNLYRRLMPRAAQTPQLNEILSDKIK